MTLDYHQVIEKLSPFIKELGAYAKECQSTNLDVSEKSQLDYVTNIDVELDQKIVRFIQKHYPEHNIFSEEGGLESKDSDYTWYIDPIDGTRSYIVGLPFWSLCIGLTYKNLPVLGMIYFPILDELFIGAENYPTTLNGKRIYAKEPTDLSGVYALMFSFNRAESKSEKNEFNEKAKKLYEKIINTGSRTGSFGAAGFSLCSVAASRMDYTLQIEQKPWDLVPGVAICLYAGFIVKDFEGNNYNSNMKNCIIMPQSLEKLLYNSLDQFVW